MNKPTIYQISIAERLGDQWSEWFDPLVIQHQPNGQTWLLGPVRDQAVVQQAEAWLGEIKVSHAMRQNILQLLHSLRQVIHPPALGDLSPNRASQNLIEPLSEREIGDSAPGQ